MRVTVLPFGFVALFALVACVPASAQDHPCPTVAAHQRTPAEEAYATRHYAEAASLDAQALAQHPGDTTLAAARVSALLHDGRVRDAAEQAQSALAKDPNGAATLTSLAEVQYQKGQPWLAMETLQAAARADDCYARAHLLRSRILRLNSMYASERKELQTAHTIEPTDPDIAQAWLHVNSAANELEAIEQATSTMQMPPEQRAQVEETVDNLRTHLVEDTQTCKSSLITDPVTFPLLPSYQNATHVGAYNLQVQLPHGSARLVVDTGASGLYISRALADGNGFEHDPKDPPHTVRARSLRVGSLEFRNCLVGVSETPFPGKGDGFIGTDVFAPYLVTLDFPNARLTLAPLPPLPKQAGSDLPPDRYVAPEVANYSPVYHRQQFLLVPVLLNNRERRMFALDTGMGISTMTSDVAHLVSSTKVNFTNSVATVGGGTVQVYRDHFDFSFANVAFDNQARVLEFDPTAIEESTGFEIAGLLGFDLLQKTALHLDYRDGLVRFDLPGAHATNDNRQIAAQGAGSVPSNPGCGGYAQQGGDLPTNVAIDAQIMGSLDSKRAKPGDVVTLKVLREWMGPDCRLRAGAMLYGKVTTAAASKGNSTLAVLFDQADCMGQNRKPLSLRTVGVVGPPDEREALHGVVPMEVHGTRSISQAADRLGPDAYDENLNPGGPPKTIRPGIVVGLSGITMAPEAGPQCSALLTSNAPSLHLGLGSEFLLVMEQDHP